MTCCYFTDVYKAFTNHQSTMSQAQKYCLEHPSFLSTKEEKTLKDAIDMTFKLLKKYDTAEKKLSTAGAPQKKDNAKQH